MTVQRTSRKRTNGKADIRQVVKEEFTTPKEERSEEFYRNRWQHDCVVRTTHGINCTGSCSWAVYVKDGIIAWDLPQTDYPLLDPSLPPYEPRGCQRGFAAAWYQYSPTRVKHPYARSALLNLWREARGRYKNPVDAWASLVENEQKRASWQRARGKGGFRRATWDELLELMASASLYTAKKWGPDRVIGFAPVPAKSMISFAAGARFVQLFGGAHLSFYDWYADLPNAFPEVWGEQTDVCESADWYNAKFIVGMGTNLSMTRTPDAHFVAEARYAGTKFVVIAPDFNQIAKNADWWIPVKAGQDTALWMAVDHVILKEFHADRQVPFFVDYLKQYTDTPFLVELARDGEGYKPARFLRANRLARYAAVENGDWKALVYDQSSGQARMPKGQVGFRWGQEQGKWNLKLEDGLDSSPIDPALTFLEQHDQVVQVGFYDFTGQRFMMRGVPAKRLGTAEGTTLVVTVFDLLMAQYGVGRGLPGDYPKDYNDTAPYTPAWQEEFTGIGRDTVIRLAREFAENAEATQGRSMVIVGASVNHWYYNNLAYRGPITALLLTGCPGHKGGGLNHYVGQQRIQLLAPVFGMSFALDWARPARLQQCSIWHYMNSDQWRYEGDFTDYASVPPNSRWAKGHAADLVAKSVRMGWMPFYPQFNRNPLEVVRDAEQAGAKNEQEIAQWAVKQIKEKRLDFAVHDPDARENWPRVWFIWKGNGIQASAKGHEFFLRHYLGTHDNVIAEEKAEGKVKTVRVRDRAPRGKMDLVVDINFRMDTSALYSDILLPTAFWYEKNDLNTTELHAFINVLGEAVSPAWESKSDWEIFKAFAKKVSELAPQVFPKPVKDLVAVPLAHDTPDELAQTEVRDWLEGECEPIPGKTMPTLRVVERDYANLYNRFISYGPLARELGMTSKGVVLPIKEVYDRMLESPAGGSPDPRRTRTVQWNGSKHPSLEDALDAANVLLSVAPETNGEVSYRGFKGLEERVGLPLADLAEKYRGVTMNFGDLSSQPRRSLTSPTWTGNVNDGRAYGAWAINVERLKPWHTLTGRQSFYIDHPWHLDFGEHLPTYKPKLDYRKTGDIVKSLVDDKSLVLNYITPHGKWGIHSSFKDNQRMLVLSRGMDPVWINDKDAERVGIQDNDWVEVYNDNGVVVTRACVSRRIQSGTCLYYHAVERTTFIPKSQIRGGRRGGSHNSITRTRINPVELAGGSAQFTYTANYWGPIGIFTRDTHCVVRKLEKLEW